MSTTLSVQGELPRRLASSIPGACNQYSTGVARPVQEAGVVTASLLPRAGLFVSSRNQPLVPSPADNGMEAGTWAPVLQAPEDWSGGWTLLQGHVLEVQLSGPVSSLSSSSLAAVSLRLPQALEAQVVLFSLLLKHPDGSVELLTHRPMQPPPPSLDATACTVADLIPRQPLNNHHLLGFGSYHLHMHVFIARWLH